MQVEVAQIELMQKTKLTEMKLTGLLKNPRSMERRRSHCWRLARPASSEDPAGSYSARFDSSGICTS